MAAHDRTPLAKQIQVRVRALRKERGWTQEELCARANLSIDAVNRIELGRRSPNLDTVDRLVAAFGVSPTALFDPDVKVNPTKAPHATRVEAMLADAPVEVQRAAVEIVRVLVRVGQSGARGRSRKR